MAKSRLKKPFFGHFGHFGTEPDLPTPMQHDPARSPMLALAKNGLACQGQNSLYCPHPLGIELIWSPLVWPMLV